METEPKLWRIGAWVFNVSAHSLEREGRKERLEQNEARLLMFLIRNFSEDPGYTNEEIKRTVWKRPSVSDDSLYQSVSKLTKVLGGEQGEYIAARPYHLVKEPKPIKSSVAASRKPQSGLDDVPRTARIGFTTNAVQAFDHSDHLLWTHSFSRMIEPDSLNHPKRLTDLVRFADLNGDGEQEVLVVVPLRIAPNPSDIAVTEVDCFSHNGRLLWSYIPKATFQFGEYPIVGPWIIWDVFISRGSKPAIWVAVGHYRWGNSFVAQLDPLSGKNTVRFVNTGTIYRINEVEIAGSRHLLIGGFNNEYAAGSLAVMNQSKSFAASPQTPGTRHKCVSCAEGEPDYYFVFPRSEINQLHDLWEDSIRYINVHGDEFEVEKSELGDPAQGDDAIVEKVHVVYVFRTRPAVKPFSFRFDSSYAILHRQLERDKRLDHSFDRCPDRLEPKPVRVWTREEGWTEVNFKPKRAAD